MMLAFEHMLVWFLKQKQGLKSVFLHLSNLVDHEWAVLVVVAEINVITILVQVNRQLVGADGQLTVAR